MVTSVRKNCLRNTRCEREVGRRFYCFCTFPLCPSFTCISVLCLEVTRGITDESDRAHALAGLAPYLSAPQLHDALEIAQALTSESVRVQVLAALALNLKHLPVVRLYSLWGQTLHTLSMRTRSNLLSDIRALAPLIAALGEKEALVATIQAVIEVGKWFP